jgi:hypothetical protein
LVNTCIIFIISIGHGVVQCIFAFGVNWFLHDLYVQIFEKGHLELAWDLVVGAFWRGSDRCTLYVRTMELGVCQFG